MATITNAITVEAVVRGGITRFLFRYTLSNGEVHEQRAWVPSNTVEATERDRRGVWLLESLAEQEAARLLSA